MRGETWHVISGEYPPDIGGVGDHTMLLARALDDANEAVHIWVPGLGGASPGDGRVVVHRELGRIAPADLARASDRLNAFPGPRRLVVQWVPHAFGWRAVNLPFAVWVWLRARRGDTVDLIVHEPYLPFSARSLRQTLAGLVQRLMAIAVLRAATRIWVVTPVWEARMRPFALGRKIAMTWLPVPSNIAVTNNLAKVSSVRTDLLLGAELLVGHFGTYGRHVTGLMERAIVTLLERNPQVRVLFLGNGSDLFASDFIRREPGIGHRVHATGVLNRENLSVHLSACDIMVQPYPDGVSARRGSVMASLAHGRAVVTTSGSATEPFWTHSHAVLLTPTGDSAALVTAVEALIRDPSRRAMLQATAARLYASTFDVVHAAAALRGVEPLGHSSS